MRNPTVSIQMPAYNADKWIAACVDSILAQDYRDFEIILYDDCSTDGTAEIMADYARRESRVRHLSAPVNGGVGAARVATYNATQGDYIWQIDADDLLAEGALRALVDAAEADRADVVRGNIRGYSKGEPHILPWLPDLPDIANTSLSQSGLLSLALFGTVRNLVRVDYIDRVGYPEVSDLRFGEDIVINSHFLANTDRLSTISMPIYLWRETPGSLTRLSKRPHAHIKSECRAHFWTFENLSVSVFAAAFYVAFPSRYRMESISKSLVDHGDDMAIEHIAGFLPIYRDYDVDWLLEMLHAVASQVWAGLRHDRQTVDFMRLMAAGEAQNVLDFIRAGISGR